MARTSISAGGTGLRLYIDMADVEKTAQAFKDARRAVTQQTRAQVVNVATETVLPTAKTRAGNLAVAGTRVSSTLIVRRASKNGAQMTTLMRGKRGRAVGLQEFGGTVSTPIYPKKKRALSLRGLGVAVAAVEGPRKYKGRLFMTKAAETKAPFFAEELAKRLAKVFPGG